MTIWSWWSLVTHGLRPGARVRAGGAGGAWASGNGVEVVSSTFPALMRLDTTFMRNSIRFRRGLKHDSIRSESHDTQTDIRRPGNAEILEPPELLAQACPSLSAERPKAPEAQSAVWLASKTAETLNLGIS